jgi:hypothetical protein
MELPAFISPFLIGAAIIVILLPKYRLQGVWLMAGYFLLSGLDRADLIKKRIFRIPYYCY